MNEREARAAKWVRRNTENLGIKPQKEKPNLPPEILRKTVIDHGEMLDSKYRDDRKLYINAMKHMPHAIFKALENMPMPWEQGKLVNVVYHTKGAITLINETPADPEPLFFSQWSSMWHAMQQVTRDRPHFERVEFPVFDADEPIADYPTHLMNAEGEQPIRSQLLDEEEDAPIISWFYDPIVSQAKSALRISPRTLQQNAGNYEVCPGVRINPRKRTWHFDIPVLSNLYNHAEVLVTDAVERNYYFLFEQTAFASAKAMGLSLIGGPTFRQPLDLVEENDDWNEFNDPRKEIVRQRLDVNSLVAFPYLYSAHLNSDKIKAGPYHHPISLRISEGDETIFDRVHPSLNQVKAVEGADKFTPKPPQGKLRMKAGFKPAFADLALEAENTRNALHLSFAPQPFNQSSGKLKRRTDISLIDSWYQARTPFTNEVKSSYARLLKESVKRELRTEKAKAKKRAAVSGKNEDEEDDELSPEKLDEARTRLVDSLVANNREFQKTRIEWLEASLQLLRQGHNALRLYIARRNLHYIHLDNNFRIQPKTVLTTKEKKKSRFGQGFHLIRELLAFLKHVVDIHVKFRLGEIDGYQLADGVHYIFTNLGKLTGIYRHKMRVMKQYRKADDLKALVFNRFKEDGVPEGPGAGFWAPAWRGWVQYLRGLTPLMTRYLENMLSRLFEGRQSKAIPHRVSKQRLDSNRDLEMRQNLAQRIRSIYPDEKVIKKVLEYFSEAWRKWKSNEPWRPAELKSDVPLHMAIKRLVENQVQEKVSHYIKTTHYQRARIQKGDAIDKNLYRKNLGRMTRLKMMQEAARQKEEETEENSLDPEDHVKIFEVMHQWLSGRNFQKIPFPKAGMDGAVEMLDLVCNRLLNNHGSGNRKTQEEREEEKLINEYLAHPHESLAKIYDHIAHRQQFKRVDMELMDSYSHTHPCYKVDATEKITDAFLEQYLWYQAAGRGLFPNWVKPADVAKEIPPALVYSWCEGVNSSSDLWETNQGEATAILQGEFVDFSDKVDWSNYGVFDSLLKEILDPTLVDFLKARHNVYIHYKEMQYLHRGKGLIRGFQFSAFLHQVAGLILDLLLLGERRASQIAGPPRAPNVFLRFGSQSLEVAHPIRGYQRDFSRIHMLLRYSAEEINKLITEYVGFQREVDPDFSPETLMATFVNKPCWPRESRMRLYTRDVLLSHAISWKFSNRVPAALATLSPESVFVSIYSANNPNLLFDMCGFEVRLHPEQRSLEGAPTDKENVWTLTNDRNNSTAKAHLQVTADHVLMIRNRIRRGLLTIGNAAFEKIAQKWNSILQETIPYYREAILGTQGLQEILIEGEKKMQVKIMMAMNSKMPKRFPPALFYAPTDIGGLGMFSIAEALIPMEDRVTSTLTDTGIQRWAAGLTHEESDRPIPNFFNYVIPWESEIQEGKRSWEEYIQKDQQNKIQHGKHAKIHFEEVEDIINNGIPRIKTLFSTEKAKLQFEKFPVARQWYRKFQMGRPIKSWWFHHRIHGNMNATVDQYRKDVIEALGGIEAILEHTLFAGTGQTNWEGFEFSKETGFEAQNKQQKMTKAQQGNLSAMPNRRFLLWWSPTINRSNVYVGFETQIELTGVRMWGKLDMLKTTMLGIFSYHLWEKIHSRLVRDLNLVLGSGDKEDLDANEVSIEASHPKKSYTFTNSSADIVLQANSRWSVCRPKLIADDETADAESEFFETLATSKYWIDIQLRWGDFDDHNIASYARGKFYDYTRDAVTRYPSETGCVIAIDLAYNCWSAFGWWIPHIEKHIRQFMMKTMRYDDALATLRRRMRMQLQIRTTQPTEANLNDSNLSELFGKLTTWIIDASKVHPQTEHTTEEGGKKFKSENGVVFMLNPKTGHLYMSVIHRSALHGQKRRRDLAQWKAVEEITATLKALPREERPQQIIVLGERGNISQKLQQYLLEFQSISIRRSDLALALAEPLFKSHPRFGDTITNAREAISKRVMIYDQWTTTMQANFCFNRLILVLRALRVDPNRTWQILEPNRSVIREPENHWPTLSTNQWAAAELQMSELIIADFCRAEKIDDPKRITATEAKQIVYGQKIRSDELNAAAHKQTEDELKAAGKTETKMVESINKDGEKVMTKVSTFAEISTKKKDWKKNACEASALSELSAERMRVTIKKAKNGDRCIVLPHDIFQRFYWCADVHASVAGLLYGVDRDKQIDEVRCITLPPQIGSVGSVNTSTFAPSHPTIEDNARLEPLGLVRVQGTPKDASQEVMTPTVNDLVLHCKLLKDNPNYTPLGGNYNTILISAGAKPSVSCVAFTDEAIKEYSSGPSAATLTDTKLRSPLADEYYRPVKVEIKTAVTGYFLIPSTGGWNYFWRGERWEKGPYSVVVDVPKEFYHISHRPAHFNAWETAAMRGRGEEEEEDYGVTDEMW